MELSRLPDPLLEKQLVATERIDLKNIQHLTTFKINITILIWNLFHETPTELFALTVFKFGKTKVFFVKSHHFDKKNAPPFIMIKIVQKECADLEMDYY